MDDKLDVLVVDDDEYFLKGIVRTLESKFKDIKIKGCGIAKKAVGIIENENPGILLTDLRMPEISGMELMTEALNINPDMCVIMITGYASIESAVESLKKGAWDFITKPVERDALYHTVGKALNHYKLACENAHLKSLVENLGSREDNAFLSKHMKMVWEKIKAIASTDYTVLITGESGSGKEYFARKVHGLSKRKNCVCNSVNCAAIPEQLLESEFFGHVKGAFTGADRDRRGFFRAAHKGTLILDEIGDISPAIQVKLLKFLEDREVKPVGSSDSKYVDVRIIALTNQNLEEKIEQGLFREDLYYRLNVLSIDVPPLRERKEDIPVLVRMFLNKTCDELKCSLIDIDFSALSYLAAQPWHGNVRELQNFIRRLAVFSGGKKIDIPLIHLVDGKNLGSAGKENINCQPYKDAKKEVVDSFSKNYFNQILKKTKGNISKASRLSGLERASIQKLIKRLDIDIDGFRNTI